MRRWLLAALALLGALADDKPIGFSLPSSWGSALEQPLWFSTGGSLSKFQVSESLISLARRAEQEAAVWRRNRTILPRKPYAKGCWQKKDGACRELATHPSFVAAARSLVGDKDIFVLATNPVRKIPGDRQDLHTDLDLWAPECSGNNSVSVWVLLEGDQTLRPSLTFVDSSHRTATLVQDVRRWANCRTIGGWYNVAERTDDRGACRADAIARVATGSARWPDLTFDITHGPTETNVGVAWLGHTWHETHDDGHRLSFLVQYGTEECVRAVRRPRHWDVARVQPPWRSDDWFAFLPVGANTIRNPSPFDDLIVAPARGGPDVSPPPPRGRENRACQPLMATDVIRHARRATPVALLERRDVPLAIRPATLTVRDSRGDEPDTEYIWSYAVSSPHLALLSALILRVRSASPPGALVPRVNALDEIRIVLEGTITYAVGFSGECGMFSVFDAHAGHVNFFPSRLAHASYSKGGTELVIYIVPRQRDMRAWANDYVHETIGTASRRLVTQAFMVADRLRFDHRAREHRSLFSNGTRPESGRMYSGIIWSLMPVLPASLSTEMSDQRHGASKDLGYRHLRSKVVSYGPPYAETQCTKTYDIIVVPLTGPIKLAGPNGSVQKVAKWSYAVIPAGTSHAFEADGGESVDILTVEFAVGSHADDDFSEEYDWR